MLLNFRFATCNCQAEKPVIGVVKPGCCGWLISLAPHPYILRAVPMVVWWLQNRQTTVPNHVFSPDGVVCRVFSLVYTKWYELKVDVVL